MTRVLVFGERIAPPPDEGIKKLTLNLATGLRACGHTVNQLTTGGVDWPEMQVRDVPTDRLLRSPQLASAVAEFRPDAVLYVPTASLTLASGLRAAMLRRHASGAPVALIATQGRRHSAAVRLAARVFRPDVCIAQSTLTVSQVQALGWPAVRVPPGVDTAAFCPADLPARSALRARLGVPDNGRTVVVHVGHLNRRRGVADLMALGSEAYPVLVASTSTPQDAALRRELESAGVRVASDYVPVIADWYRAADVYLFPVPPRPEEPSSIDFPLSVLEAVACNVPVVTRRFGALPELWGAEDSMHYYDSAGELPAAVARARSGPGPRHLAENLGWPAIAGLILKELVRSRDQASRARPHS